MAASNFTIGQRVRVVRVGAWNGTPPLPEVRRMAQREGTVAAVNRDTIGVEMWWNLGILQFLPDELEPLTD